MRKRRIVVRRMRRRWRVTSMYVRVRWGRRAVKCRVHTSVVRIISWPAICWISRCTYITNSVLAHIYRMDEQSHVKDMSLPLGGYAADEPGAGG